VSSSSAITRQRILLSSEDYNLCISSSKSARWVLRAVAEQPFSNAYVADGLPFGKISLQGRIYQSLRKSYGTNLISQAFSGGASVRFHHPPPRA
jgi:hypothetical protein